MYKKSVIILSVCLLIATVCSAQTKKPAAKPKPKPKTTKTTVKKTTPPPAAPAENACFPLKVVKDYYKIDLKEAQFKSDYEEIFELSTYDYSGYALKSIIENTVRMKLGDAAANSLDMFAGSSYLEINFTDAGYKKQLMDEICTLFSDADAFEKHIKTLKKKSREESGWRSN